MSANEVIKLRSTDESKGLESVEPQAFTDELPAGTRLLNKQYTITGYLNSGGFGITYIAEDSLHRTVVIKECFPGFMCRRVGKDVHVRSIEHHGELASIVTAFINEARALAALDHEGIVKVHQVFEENNTAYMAMDYVKGLDLAEIIDRHPGAVSPARIVKLTRRILTVVDYVHQRGILHRDISPDNIIISKSGEPLLIDFGSAYEHIKKAGTETQQLKCVKDGYSPQEFYVPDGEQGPWSDLYSLAATLYDVLKGEPPAPAQQRLAAMAKGRPDPYGALVGSVEGYPGKYLKAIDLALQVMPEDRFQTAQDWLSRITTRKPTKPANTVKTDRTKRPTNLLEQKFDERPDVTPTEDEPGLMAAVQEAAELRDAHIRTIIADEPAQSSLKTPTLLVAALTLSIGVGGIGYFQFMQPDVQTAVAPTPASAEPAAARQPVQIVGTPSGRITDVIEAPAVVHEEVSMVAKADAQAATIAISSAVPLARPFADVQSSVVDAGFDAMGLLALAQTGGYQNRPALAYDAYAGLELGAAISSVEMTTMVAENQAEKALSSSRRVQARADAARAAFEAMVASLSDIPPVAAQVEIDLASVGGAEVAPILTAPVAQELPTTLVAEAMPGAKQRFAEVAFAFATVPPAPLPEKVVVEPVQGAIIARQVAFSHWDLNMPFEAEVRKVRNASVATITSVNAESVLTLAGPWIEEGVVIYTYNGVSLSASASLSGQVLNNLQIDPDGYSRGSVRYREPATGRIDRGLLAVPVVREIGLADGTTLTAAVAGENWVITVATTAEGSNLRAGDQLLQEVTTGIAITNHEDLTAAFDALVRVDADMAQFQILRDDNVQNVRFPLAREAAPNGVGQ